MFSSLLLQQFLGCLCVPVVSQLFFPVDALRLLSRLYIGPHESPTVVQLRASFGFELQASKDMLLCRRSAGETERETPLKPDVNAFYV